MHKKIKLLLLAVALGAATRGVAQDWHDYTWVMGYGEQDTSYTSEEEKFGWATVDFRSSPPAMAYIRHSPVFMNALTGICDGAGDVVFYTNGCRIANRQHRLMEGGDSLNTVSLRFESYCLIDRDHGLWQGLLALPPFPGGPPHYHLLHLAPTAYAPYAIYHDLLHTVVDASGDGGLGAVVAKNVPVATGLPVMAQLNAVRHANGRDWWVTLPNWASDTMYVWRLAPDGLHGPVLMSGGPPWATIGSWGIPGVFSPDGSLFAHANHQNGLDVYRFDRCTGAFAHAGRVANYDLPPNPEGQTGVSFSPSSRFLYLSWRTRLYQFDMAAPDWEASIYLVATAQRRAIVQHQLAPDGKIYMSSSITMPHLHVIHAPNRKGADSRFEEMGLDLPVHRGWMMPNLPNYRLYELPGSPCDTLGVSGGLPPPKGGVVLYPNPARGATAVSLPLRLAGEPAAFLLYDALGRVVRRLVWEGYPTHMPVDLDGLPAAMYFWELHSRNVREGHGKLVVVR